MYIRIKVKIKKLLYPYIHHILRIFNKKSSIKESKKIVFSTTYLGERDTQVFFGYHDKTPFNEINNQILAMHAKVDGTDSSSECKTIDLGVYDLDENMNPGPFQALAQTKTWCWQQGCMLQWDPISPKDKFYFNDLVEGKYGAKCFSISENKIIKSLPFPIYAINPNGVNALTLNFSRLGRLRPGYGYSLLDDDSKFNSAPKGEGLSLFNLNTGKCKLLVDLFEISKSVDSNKNVHHYINHPSFSTNGSYVTFFHIWAKEASNKRKIRLMCLNLKNGELKIIEEKQTPSHFTWKNDEQLLSTTIDKSLIWRYCIYDIKTGVVRNLELDIKQDGHPMLHPKYPHIMLSDSYPDKLRDQHLYITNLNTGKTLNLSKFYSPYKFNGQSRCDLHPRWDRKGGAVVVDTAFSGTRQMAILKIDIKSIIDELK